MMRRLVVGILAVGGLMLSVSGAGASTTTTLTAIHYHGDSFYNYDFDSQSASATNVDWPVDLVFWGKATVSKVYSKIGYAYFGSDEYAQVNDGSGAVWVASAGRKNGFCAKVDTHFRLYAPPVGYFTNNVLGHYVIATAHLDKNECTSTPTYGWNETAETHIAKRAVTAWGASAVQTNAQAMPDGTPTLSLFNNAQTGWQGNHYFNNNGYPTLIKVS
jgi:hypothetical protein